jgi:hypothetical protein
VFEIKSLLNNEKNHRQIEVEKLQYAKTMLEVSENEVTINGLYYCDCILKLGLDWW